MSDNLLRRTVRKYTLCNIGFHRFGFNLKTAWYKDIFNDKKMHRTCSACYRAEIEAKKGSRIIRSNKRFEMF